MIKFLRVTCGILALLLAGLAPTAFARSAPAAAVQIADPALWKVSGPDATIYLFGTIHLLPANVRWLDGTVAEAFTHADTLVTEILEPTPAAMRPIILAKAMLPPGQVLSDLLTPSEGAALDVAQASDRLPAGSLHLFRPWFAAITLATVNMIQLGYDPANGVDNQLSQRAEALGLKHEALETMEFQLGLFAGLPQPVQKAYLLEVIKQLPQLKTELSGIIHAWETGKAAELAKLMNADEDDPQMMQTLLFDRNKTWAKWIQARLAKPDKPREIIFIAVGAGHLAGPGSVMDELRKLGIASQRVQ